MIARTCLIGISLCAASPAQTSADNPRLKEAFERNPEADSNKDGVLTLQEAKVFKSKRIKERSKGDGLAPEGGERHVYDLTLEEMDGFFVDLGWLKQKYYSP